MRLDFVRDFLSDSSSALSIMRSNMSTRKITLTSSAARRVGLCSHHQAARRQTQHTHKQRLSEYGVSPECCDQVRCYSRLNARLQSTPDTLNKTLESWRVRSADRRGKSELAKPLSEILGNGTERVCLSVYFFCSSFFFPCGEALMMAAWTLDRSSIWVRFNDFFRLFFFLCV